MPLQGYTFLIVGVIGVICAVTTLIHTAAASPQSYGNSNYGNNFNGRPPPPNSGSWNDWDKQPPISQKPHPPVKTKINKGIQTTPSIPTNDLVSLRREKQREVEKQKEEDRKRKEMFQEKYY